MRHFLLFLLAISFLGLVLRFIDYDRIPPFGETQDEFFYPWAGMTLIQKGVPAAWSLFPSYPQREYLSRWGINYPIVSPWVEKPPLYSLIVGSFVTLKGQTNLDQVRLADIRLIPILVSAFTVFLIGLLAKSLFNWQIGLLSSFFYATIPTIVLSNRLSLVENMFTPIVLFALLLLKKVGLEKENLLLVFALGMLSGLAVLTKNIGITLPAAIILYYFFQKKWKEISIIFAISLAFFMVHPLMGLYYDWELFLNVLKDYQQTHALVGLPELVSTIFRFPTVASKERIFLDGSMLAGFILLFSSPFWLRFDKDNTKQTHILLGFPLIYIFALAILESGQTDFSYFGWHIFPLFPFICILLSFAAYNYYHAQNVFKSIVLFLILGFSTVRFLLLIMPELQNYWQHIIGVSFALFFLTNFLPLKKQRIAKLIFLGIYFAVNVLVVVSFSKIYPSFPQPSN